MEKQYSKVVYYDKKDVRIEKSSEIPDITENEILVEVEACAICGSDIKTYLHGNPRMKPATTVGHEFCGKIIETGKNVSQYQTGQRVTMATSLGCGECIYCKAGKTNLCKHLEAMGFHINGAMSKYVRIPEKAVKNNYVVPVGDLDYEAACLSEPMSCVVNGLSRVPLKEIRHAVVIGLGTLGVFHLLALRHAGVENIVGVANPGKKKDIVSDLGFDNYTPEEFEERYMELSGGEGFELVVITAPSNKIQSAALKYARKGGYVSYFASLPVGDNMINIDSRLLHYGELILFGTSDSTSESVKQGIEILTEYKELIKKIITPLPMSQYMDGVEGVIAKQYAKVVLIP